MGALLVCAAALLLYSPARAGDPTMQLSTPDNGREVTLDRGESFEVRLESQAGTGYLWEFAVIDAVFLEVAGERTVLDPEPGRLGGPAANIWTLRTRAAGLTELRMIYRRPWEKLEKAAATFSVRLRILP